MTRGKRIALVLGGLGAVLALLVVAQQAGLGRGYSKLAADDEARADNFGRIDVEPVKLAAFSDYGDIVSRPVFNETRAPEAQPATPTDGAEAAAAASPLNVTLTGVMLMPSLQIAFVRDNATGTVHRVRVGNPLEGDQSGWKLVELMPRKAVFEGEGLGRQEIELTVDTAGAPAMVAPGAPKPEVQPAVPGQPAVAGQPMPGQPPVAGQLPAPTSIPGVVQPTEQPAATSADQIRQRIEERRRQLREEAQRMMQDQNKQQ